MHLTELRRKSTDELRTMAESAGVDGCSALRRHDLLVEVLKDLGRSREEIRAEGVLEVLSEGFGFLRCAGDDFQPGSEDIYVSPSQIRRFDLRTGDAVEGVIRAPKEGERYFALLRVSQVNELDPDQRPKRSFGNLAARRPAQRLDLSGASHPWVRLIDAIAPIGRGQRCTIAAPAGGAATSLLHAVCSHVADQSDDVSVIVALLDARPEDIDELADGIAGDVVAASIAQPPSRVVQVAEMTVKRAKRLVELGRDVVLALDSLTALYRAARAYPGEDTQPWAPIALIKSVLAGAHRCEGGGSLTLFATLGTDRDVADEIAGIANCELVLIRTAEGRIELDPLSSRAEYADGFVAEAERLAMHSARAALANLDRAGAVDRAAQASQASQDRAELVRDLADSE